MNNTRTGAAFIATPQQSRSVIRRSAACFTGYIPSHKVGNDRRLIAWEGTIERDFIYLLEDDDAVVSYWEQPIPFEWHDGLTTRLYTPDFDVFTDTDRRLCVEVKPLAIVEAMKLRPLYRVLRDAAVESGRYDDFQLWTDRDVRDGNDLTNARLRYSERAQFFENTEGVAVRSALKGLGGRGTVKAVRRASGLGSRAYRAILRLMAEGACRTLMPGMLIEDDTVIVWGEY